MKSFAARPMTRTLVALALVALLIGPALAGPPLICHPLDIDSAASLPWDGSDGFQDIDDSYDVTELTRDVANLLGASTPVLVRMETLRRAALYARDDQKLAGQLLAELAERADTGDTLAVFDYGYAIRIYAQMREPMPRSREDGYALVRRAAEQSGDAEMEFAAAVISLHPRRSSLDDHLRRALSGAEPGSRLERNLVHQFEHRGKTIAALRTSAGLSASR